VTVPRPAATIILVRDGETGLEVFLMERNVRSGFAGGAHVFPGGRVDQEDLLASELCVGMSDEQASRLLCIDSGGLRFFVAALRECFEEAGILLAYDRGGALLDLREETSATRFAPSRQRIHRGELTLAELLRTEGLRLATDRVYYWAHWITPEASPKRYDTRFFVAEAPPHQTGGHDEHELVGSSWVAPRAALERAAAGEWTIIFPTRRTLMALAEHDSAASVIEAARAKRDRPAMQPRLLKLPEGIVAVLPGEPGYDEAESGEAGVPSDLWDRGGPR
jgi:8-oxo-dGTP pyrophosphatase MutT (NUDIX family)